MGQLNFPKKSVHRSVGAGRASGALAFELVIFAKTSSSHIALLGGAFILPVAQEVEARFAFTAMQVNVLAEFLCFGTVFDLILQGQGERFGGVSL